MKCIDPTKEYEFKPDWAPEITVYYVQPHGVSQSYDPKLIPAEYINRFVKRVEGLEIPEHLKNEPLDTLMPPRLANAVFLEISRAGKLTEDEERD